MDMNDIMQQAQMMQEQLARAQEEAESLTHTATAGGGMVKATALGNGTIQSIEINPEAVDPEDVEMLQDMVLAAVNAALRGVSEAGEQHMASATGGLSSLSNLAGSLDLSGLF